MNKNESIAVKRRVGPIPFYDNDGNKLMGLDFKTALGHVFVCSEAGDYVASAADVVTRTGSYYYEFSQAETNVDAFIAVKLSRPGTTGNSTATAANSLTNSGAGMTANQYKGQTLIDSAGSRWPIASHTATVFTLTAAGATPAAGAYVVEAYRDIEWNEKIDTTNSTILAQLGIRLYTGQAAATFSRTQYVIATADSPPSTNDFFKGQIVTIYDDTTAARVGATAVCENYNGSTGTMTMVGTGFPIAPSSASKVAIIPAMSAPSTTFGSNLFDGSFKLEGTWSPGDVVRLIASISAGKVADFQSGTLTFRDLLDTVDRWTVTTDPSGRISITPGNLAP